jgi:acetylornithine/succinyldiaminopimelate/putrescine aminotransferase
VLVDVGRLGLSDDEALVRLREEGVLLSHATRRNVLRAVTHLDVSTDQIDEAVERVPRALAAVERAGTTASAQVS